MAAAKNNADSMKCETCSASPAEPAAEQPMNQSSRLLHLFSFQIHNHRKQPRKQCTVSVLILLSLQSGEKLDKIELAFRKFDKNQDGFLSKEEFDVVSFPTRPRILG